MKNKLLLFTFISIVLILLMSNCRESDYVLEETDIVISDNGLGLGTVTWTKDKEYTLEGLVFVNDGQVLTIEAGTVIKARRGQGTAATALIVARGGKIIAEGTAVDPIIFTCEGDDLEGSVEANERGLWGGVILLGSAPINTISGEAHVEGIESTEPRGIYGGNNVESNSGILSYVSIRHGGTDIGHDNEINGLTLAGVGSKTIIENVEVIANADDGIEIFGGTVNLKNIVVTNCSDDAIDIDLGYQGNGQYWCLLQNMEVGDKIIEIDGGEEIKTALPYSLPVIYNITAVGRGSEISNKLISFDDNAGGTICNSVFINQDKGISIEYSSARNNSYTQFENSNLKIYNNIFFNVNANEEMGLIAVNPLNDEEITTEQQVLNSYFYRAANTICDPEFKTDGTGYKLISDSEYLTNKVGEYPDDSFFYKANYNGAFGSYNWVGEWTLSFQAGFIY